MSEIHPTVTAVVATHNRPELLRGVLRAVFAQNYPGDLDVIVVYDQAEPEAGLADEFPGEALEIITNTRTPGLAGARNTGVLHAGGDFIAFCDDDDDWFPEKLTAQFALRNGDAGIGVVATGVVVTYDGDEHPRVPDRDRLTKHDLLQSRVFAAHPSSVVVHRQTMIDEIGLVDEAIPGSYGEDYEWILRAAAVTEIAVVTRPLVLVRWHAGGSFFSDRWLLMVDGIDYILEREPEFASHPRGLAYMYGRQAFALAAADRPGEARRKAWNALKASWRERRAYLALAVSWRLISADRLMQMAHRRGRGI